MAIYQIEWKKSAVRELKRLDRQVVPRIVAAVEALAENPDRQASVSCGGANAPIVCESGTTVLSMTCSNRDLSSRLYESVIGRTLIGNDTT